MKHRLFSLLLATLFLLVGVFSFPRTAFAQACEDVQCASEDRACLEKKRACLEAKIKETQAQASTLKGAISVLNGRISLQQLQVNQTQAEITQLEQEIGDLSQRIEGLGYSLDRLGSVLIERVREQYKQSRSTPELELIGSSSLSGLINQMKYLLFAQRQTAQAMERTETQRLEYDQQKVLKEEKQKEIETKRRQLQAEQNVLAQQRKEQQDLLTITNSSEQRYQSLLAQANSQLASFTRFARSIGVSLLSGQTKCDGWGCYYSQRDSQWGSMLLGGSNYSVAEAGCLVTSMAMVATHYKGQVINPGQIASNGSLFNYADLKQGQWTANGVTMSRSPACSSSSCLDSELEGGRPVIVRLAAANFAGTHFIVILEKKDGNYIMHDPAIANGHNLKFTDHYSLGSITRVDRVSVQ